MRHGTGCFSKKVNPMRLLAPVLLFSPFLMACQPGADAPASAEAPVVSYEKAFVMLPIGGRDVTVGGIHLSVEGGDVRLTGVSADIADAADMLRFEVRVAGRPTLRGSRRMLESVPKRRASSDGRAWRCATGRSTNAIGIKRASPRGQLDGGEIFQSRAQLCNAIEGGLGFRRRFRSSSGRQSGNIARRFVQTLTVR